MFTSSPHTGLLWALESLAWSPEQLGRASHVLARLAELDPGGRLSNRPSASLHAVFRIWYPGTVVPWEARLASIDSLRQRTPSIAWNLLIDLLPETHEVATPTHEPRWRNWLESGRPNVTNQERMHGVSSIVDRLLEDALAEPMRLSDLIERLDDLPRDSFDQVTGALSAVDAGSLPIEVRSDVGRALRKLISRHCEFPEADWAMPAADVARLIELHAQFADEDPVAEVKHLFARHPLLLEATAGGWQERLRIVSDRQVEGLRLVFDSLGLDGIFTLAESAEDPWAIGQAAVRGELGVDASLLLASSLDASTSLQHMALGYIGARVAATDDKWIRVLLATPDTRSWTDQMRGRLLVMLPFTLETWALLETEAPGVQDAYWREVRVHGWGHDIPVQVIEAAVPQLQARGRVAAAVDLLGLYGRAASPVIIADALEQLARRGPELEGYLQQIAYEVGELLSGLEPSEELPLDQIVQLEWIYMNLRGHGEFQARHLQEGLAANPRFFVELLKLAFRPMTSDDDTHDDEGEHLDDDIDEERRRRASNAFRLLYDWRTPPGLDPDGSLNPQTFRDWVAAVRELAAADDRAEIADEVIGQVLVHLPEGADGIRPPEVVREIFEEVESRHLENGYVMGILNSRGVTSRGLTEGGVQERTLVGRYRADADAVAAWPITSRVLRAVAASYEADAQREDRRSELHEEGIFD